MVGTCTYAESAIWSTTRHIGERKLPFMCCPGQDKSTICPSGVNAGSIPARHAYIKIHRKESEHDKI
jgi:hypothetical protein